MLICQCAFAQTPALKGCIRYDKTLSEHAANKWRQTIQETHTADADAFNRWLVGLTSPPDGLIAEVRQQAKCMVIDYLRSSGVTDKQLIAMELPEEKAGRTLRLARRHRKLSNAMSHLAFLAHHRKLSTQRFLWRKRARVTEPLDDYIPRKELERCQSKDGMPRGECRRLLQLEKRELKALRGTAAPGLSRHHWGTEVDLFAVNRYRFRDRGPLGGLYRWLKTNAHRYGFFQPYHGQNPLGYIEERWHWSYAPVSVPLLEHIRTNVHEYTTAVEEQWRAMASRWNRNRKYPLPYFDAVRKRMTALMYDVTMTHYQDAMEALPPQKSNQE
ncbi:MAG: D-alanyl-D-alanine carboxypeptidase family protein [Bradymonadia bacterium]